MKKELIIGIGAIAAVGAIGGGFMLASDGSLRQEAEAPAGEVDAETREKIDALAWEEWRDAERYGFCFAEATMTTFHTDPVLNQYGEVDHRSRELLLYDAEAEKLFVLTRKVTYSYEGKLKTVMGDIMLDIPVSEEGALHEVYTKRDMPIRIDYANGYIVSDPTTKQTLWVRSSLDEDELVMPHPGCAGMYALDNSPGNDLLVGGEVVVIDKVCDEQTATGNYSGDLSFSCSSIGYTDAKALYDAAKEVDSLDTEFDQGLFDGTYSEEEQLQDAIGNGTEPQDGESVKKALEDMKKDLGGAQSAADERE